METLGIILAICGGFLTIANVIDKLVAWIKEIKKPQTDLEQRVEKLEKQIEGEYRLIFADYEMRFKRDLERLNKLEETNNLVIKALLALMRNAETGNNKEKLKQVGDELQDYILNK